MPIQLTVDQVITNGRRLILDKRRMLEDEKIFTCQVQMRTATNGTPADVVVSRADLEIRAPNVDPQGQPVAGFGTVIARKTLASGEALGQILTHNPNVSVDDTQWNALVTAYKTSLAALETHLLTRYLHTSLAGS